MAQVYIGKGVTEAAFCLGVIGFLSLVGLKAFDAPLYNQITYAAVSVVNDFVNWAAQTVLRFLQSLFRF